MRPERILLGTALVVAFLAGCSDDAPGTGAGAGGTGTGTGVASPTGEPVPDPCTLVTQDAVSAAVGAPVADGLSELVSAPGFEGGRQCSFRTADNRGAFSVEVWPVTPELFALDKEQSKRMGGNVEEAAGLGDSAFTVGYTELHVLKGPFLVKLSLAQVSYDPDESRKHLDSLAKASVGQL